MKIAVPTVQGRLSLHFGHCESFTFFEIENDQITNKYTEAPPPHAPGVLPTWLKNKGVNLVIAGGMGTRAQGLFQQNGIQVIVGAPAIEPERVVSDYLEGKLELGENICEH